jgi:Mg2+-importing ATPase
VLLQPDLDVLRRGIAEGRTTFANTLKYIQTTTSANLGNMISMALASLFLSFLPLTAGQILSTIFCRTCQRWAWPVTPSIPS